MTFSRRARIAGALALALPALVALASASASAADPNAISIVDPPAFQPTTLTVNAGDTVTWTVTNSTVPHSVTSGTGPSDPNSGKTFDSGIVLRKNGDTFSFTFTTPGSYPFYCQVHPLTMSGTITVNGGGGGSTASGAPASSGAPPSSGAPTASEAPASAAPAGSGAPAASAAPVPPGSERDSIPTQDKAIAAGILVVALVVLFGSAMLYRRVNRA